MKRGLIPDTLVRLKAKNFAPNMEHEILLQENERALIEWARRPDEQPKEGIYGLPSRWLDRKVPWYRKLTMIIP